MRHVEVLLFAQLREAAGRRTLRVAVADGATVADAWEAARAVCPALGASREGLRAAVDEQYASWSAPLDGAATVAFIPPVAGGSEPATDEPQAAVHVRLTDQPLDARELEALVRSDADGAVCTFTGVVRNHADGRAVERLEYEAYAAMAETEMRRIGADALRRSGATALAVAHRVGTLGIGEASVVVAASAPHRAEAFAACRYAIDTLKAQAPIWKKEHGEGGAVWVDETLRPH